MNKMSTLPLQPIGGPSPASGIRPTSGMPLEVVELPPLPALAAAESSPELLVDIAALAASPPVLLSAGLVVTPELKPDSLPPLLRQAMKPSARAARVVVRATTRRIA
ncbi:hypothetical protein [Nannocystis pusilla]|uniref:hypothetical protein n=1 Tax=Nannocystis pusilla TaxID=889268 RepID=UPI003B7B64EE